MNEQAEESAFWLEVSQDSGLVSPAAVEVLIKEADELTAIFAL